MLKVPASAYRTPQHSRCDNAKAAREFHPWGKTG